MPITFVGWTGILLGFLAIFLVAGRERGISRLSIALALAAFQTAVGFYFYEWAQTGTSDATTYYYDRLGYYERGFGLNTQFVIWIVQGIKQRVRDGNAASAQAAAMAAKVPMLAAMAWNFAKKAGA